MKILKSLIVFAILAISSGLSAAELGDKLERTAKTFGEAAVQRNLTGTVLAVFPFQTDEKLAKKRVDFAVSELLAHDLLKQGSFKIVERAQLEEVMKEQKLGLSGAVDSKTAAGIGKLLGARTLVLGNVIKMGGSYQITSKLIDAETSEMLSSEIIEVPIETFDKEAEHYLVLVPEREALGLYAGLSYFPVVKKKLPTVTNPAGTGAGVTITPGTAKADYSSVEVGLRYQAAKRTVLDFSFLADANIGGDGNMFTTNQAPSAKSDNTLSGYGFRISANRVSPLSGSWVVMYGVGFQGHIWRFFRTPQPNIEFGSSSPKNSIEQHAQSASIYTFFGRLGAEWRPTRRFGWGLFSQFNQPKTLTCAVTVKKAGTVTEYVKVMEAAFPVVTLNTTFSFYF